LVQAATPATPFQLGFARAGHAHAGVLLILALTALLHADAAHLSGSWSWLARLGAPVAALLMPGGFFAPRPEGADVTESFHRLGLLWWRNSGGRPGVIGNWIAHGLNSTVGGRRGIRLRDSPRPRTTDRMASVIMVRAGVLDVGVERHGDPAGWPVVLLHGFPYDPRCYDDVVPALEAAGAHVVVPYLRGYGATHFTDLSTPRSGQQAALAADLRELINALDLAAPILAGFDWGGRAACLVAALWPHTVGRHLRTHPPARVERTS
jgi:alpha/beta hydrolase fold